MNLKTPLAGALLAGLALAGGAEAAEPAAVSVDVHHGTLIVHGTPAADAIALRPAGRRLAIDVGRDGSAEFRVERRRFDRVLILAGDGDDVVDGGPDDDVVLLGAGDDRFVWDPGDGSDAVEGQDGADEQVFNGSDAGERFAATAHRGRVRFTRDAGDIEMRLGGVERLATSALGGADTFVAGDLTGTAVNDVETDLAGAPGGAPDGAGDRVVVQGTEGSDFPSVFGSATSTLVGGAALVHVRNADPADELTVEGRGGSDTINAGGLPATAMRLTLDGGSGDDSISGGHGDDVLLGGDGTDVVDPNGGDDTALLGADLDIVRWDPGDGSDIVEGQSGQDVLLFIGSADPEAFGAAARGRRVRFTRDLGGIEMDLGSVEKIDTLAQGGADALTVGDLAGTAMQHVEVNLGGSLGGPASDGAADRVAVAGTAGDDAIAVKGAKGTVDVSGLPATVRITRADAATDALAIAGGDGADTLDASALAPQTIGLSFTD